jgi:hypothetical protein
VITNKRLKYLRLAGILEVFWGGLEWIATIVSILQALGLFDNPYPRLATGHFCRRFRLSPRTAQVGRKDCHSEERSDPVPFVLAKGQGLSSRTVRRISILASNGSAMQRTRPFAFGSG